MTDKPEDLHEVPPVYEATAAAHEATAAAYEAREQARSEAETVQRPDARGASTDRAAEASAMALSRRWIRAKTGRFISATEEESMRYAIRAALAPVGVEEAVTALEEGRAPDGPRTGS